MNVSAIIPVGPGHERVARQAVASVWDAWHADDGDFSSVEVCVVPDHAGHKGRSRARNEGVSGAEADWILFLDADDLLLVESFRLAGDALMCSPGLVGIWGAIMTERLGVTGKNVCPLSFAQILHHRAVGTLSMGCFVRADRARATPFDVNLSNGEDFDFYLRLLAGGVPFVKLEEPLALIRDKVPNCDGTEGEEGQWQEACDLVFDRYMERAEP